MVQITILTNTPEAFTALAEGLAADSRCHVRWAQSMAAARAAVAASAPDLMIIDETVDGQSCLAIARQLIRTNALINLAAVSSLTAEAFHGAAEGLGILVQLPPRPPREQTHILLAALARITPVWCSAPENRA